MIEVPRAALLANEIAEYADFFSFGTNDLTQMTFGLSRDDSARFLPGYIESGVLRERSVPGARCAGSRAARAARNRARPGSKPVAVDRRLRRARRRSAVDRVLPSDWVGLCKLLAVSGASCASGRCARGAVERLAQYGSCAIGSPRRAEDPQLHAGSPDGTRIVMCEALVQRRRAFALGCGSYHVRSWLPFVIEARCQCSRLPSPVARFSVPLDL